VHSRDITLSVFFKTNNSQLIHHVDQRGSIDHYDYINNCSNDLSTKKSISEIDTIKPHRNNMEWLIENQFFQQCESTNARRLINQFRITLLFLSVINNLYPGSMFISFHHLRHFLTTFSSYLNQIIHRIIQNFVNPNNT
jgi:hypothetical protein